MTPSFFFKEKSSTPVTFSLFFFSLHSTPLHSSLPHIQARSVAPSGGAAPAAPVAAGDHGDLPIAKRPPPSSWAMPAPYPNDLTVSCKSSPLASMMVANLVKVRPGGCESVGGVTGVYLIYTHGMWLCL